MTFSQLFLFVAVLCVSVCGITGYSVSGKNILDASGNKVTLRGVVRPSFEWSATGEKASLEDYKLMKNKWAANIVRIPLNQDFWFASSSYTATIDQQVAWITSLGMGVILDLHWNQGGQQNMADKNSITFWSQVAAHYKNNEDIMFELYNEPHDISWNQWLNGDSSYAGMQSMYDAVRATGANNVVVVGGMNWAYDLSGVISGLYKVKGTNLAYATHPYDYAGKQLGDWVAGFGALAATAPVIMTEFGQYCATNTYVADLLNYAEALGIHYTAWAWYVNGCAFPSVISDWNGTPFPGVGDTVFSYVQRNTKSGSTSGSSSSSGSVATPKPAATTRPGTGATSAPVTSAPVTSAPSTPSVPASGSLSVYADGVTSGWQDWSWSTSYSLSDSQFVYSGSKSIRFEAVAYQGVYLHATNTFSLNSYANLVFWVNGGTSAKAANTVSVKVYSTSNTVIGNSVNLPVAIAANQWNQVVIPVSSFGVSDSAQITGLVLQSNVAASAGNIWVDDIAFVPAGSAASPATQAPATQAPVTQAPATQAPVTQAPVTQAPATKAPTKAPATQTPATQAPATQAPATQAPATQAPSTGNGCDTSSVRLVQSSGGSWASNGKTISQFNVEISHSCPGKRLVGLTVQASNWSPSNFWNMEGSGSTLNLPSYTSIPAASSLVVGYQNTAGQASFTITSVTFQ